MSVKQSWHEDEVLVWFKSSYSAGNGGECVEIALEWRKSSYSNDQGGQCVEVALGWQKSSFSAGNGGDCVEIASCPHAVHVRDSKDVSRPGLAVGPEAWASFVGFARR